MSRGCRRRGRRPGPGGRPGAAQGWRRCCRCASWTPRRRRPLSQHQSRPPTPHPRPHPHPTPHPHPRPARCARAAAQRRRPPARAAASCAAPRRRAARRPAKALVGGRSVRRASRLQIAASRVAGPACTPTPARAPRPCLLLLLLLLRQAQRGSHAAQRRRALRRQPLAGQLSIHQLLLSVRVGTAAGRQRGAEPAGQARGCCRAHCHGASRQVPGPGAARASCSVAIAARAPGATRAWRRRRGGPRSRRPAGRRRRRPPPPRRPPAPTAGRSGGPGLQGGRAGGVRMAQLSVARTGKLGCATACSMHAGTLALPNTRPATSINEAHTPTHPPCE